MPVPRIPTSAPRTRRPTVRAPAARAALAALPLLLLAACGGGGDSPSDPAPGGPRHALGMSVTGLATGQSVVLQNQGTDDFSASANGYFQTAATWPEGSSYTITVKTQPAGQRCTPARNTGTVAAGLPSVLIECKALPSERNTLGGTISGVFPGQTVVLTTGSEDLALKADGSFTFATQLAAGAAYAVTLKAKPEGFGCIVRNGSGSINTTAVDTVAVRCAPEGLVSEGFWEQDQCSPGPGGVGLRDGWRISRNTLYSASVGAGGVSYNDAQCGGVGTPMTGPLVGGFSVDQMRSASTSELTAYWGVRSGMMYPAKPVVLVRKANHLCLLEDSATPSAYPDAASTGPAVAAAIAAGKCYTPR